MRKHILLITVLLSGCAVVDRFPVTHSWDRTIETDGAVTNERYSYITYERSTATSDDSVAAETEKAPNETKPTATCEPFVPPPAEPMPSIPDILPSDRKDPERVGTILVGHIAQLREYIRKRDKATDDAFIEYRKKCKAFGTPSQ